MKEELLTAYSPALAMLNNCINLCPDEFWADDNKGTPFWRIAYHTLFYTDFYLSDGPQNFRPWENHLATYNALGEFTPDGQKVIITTVYVKEQLKAYLTQLTEALPNRINEETLTSPCGFAWVRKSNLGLHLYIIRHIQHHTGQLVERLHGYGIKGIAWLG